MHRTICLLVGSGAAAVSCVAGAGGLTMTFVGDATGCPVGVHHDASAAWDAGRASSFSWSYVGARDFTSSGRSFRTFATRLAGTFTIGQVVSYAQVDPGDLPGGHPAISPIGGLRADLLSDLYGRYWSFAATDADPSFVAGFQLAIWEIMNENVTGTTREDAAAQLTLDIGAFQADFATDSVAFNSYVQANMMLSSLGNGPFSSLPTLRGWTDGGPREQLSAVIVPLPAPALMAAAGLLAARSRRRVR